MVGILLAAGFSRRFGFADKLLHRLPDGQAIALACAKHLVNAMPNSIAVVRSENKELAKLLKATGLEVIFCHEHHQYMADSLVTAICATTTLEAANDGFVIALADMPYIQSATIGAVASRVSAGASIVIPTFHGQRGHPVGFSAKFRSDLERLQGDEGARSIIERFTDEIEFLPCDDAGILKDIDFQTDLRNYAFIS